MVIFNSYVKLPEVPSRNIGLVSDPLVGGPMGTVCDMKHGDLIIMTPVSNSRTVVAVTVNLYQ